MWPRPKALVKKVRTTSSLVPLLLPTLGLTPRPPLRLEFPHQTQRLQLTQYLLNKPNNTTMFSLLSLPRLPLNRHVELSGRMVLLYVYGVIVRMIRPFRGRETVDVDDVAVIVVGVFCWSVAAAHIPEFLGVERGGEAWGRVGCCETVGGGVFVWVRRLLSWWGRLHGWWREGLRAGV